MLDLAPIFLRSITPALVAERPDHAGMNTWLIKGTFGMTLGSPGEIILNGISAKNFFPFLFSDYIRFALASKESIHLSFNASFDKRALAWPCINRYYSAFFSAHALLRSHSRGVIWLDNDEISHLEDVGKIYIGPAFTMNRGGYSFEFDVKNGFNAEVKLIRMGQGGGSHDEFWKYFAKYLSSFGNLLLQNNIPSAAQAVARLEELKALILAPSSKGSWLSFMRNEINYQHKFGVWYPFTPATSGGSIEKRVLQQSNAVLDLSAKAKQQPLKAFNAVTCYLASLNNDFALLIKARAGVGALHFQTKWDKLQNLLDA